MSLGIFTPEMTQHLLRCNADGMLTKREVDVAIAAAEAGERDGVTLDKIRAAIEEHKQVGRSGCGDNERLAFWRKLAEILGDE